LQAADEHPLCHFNVFIFNALHAFSGMLSRAPVRDNPEQERGKGLGNLLQYLFIIVCTGIIPHLQ
jgi:hypothetical protein